MMTERSDGQADTQDISLLPLNEEVKRVEQLVEFNMALHEKSLAPHEEPLCADLSGIVKNADNGPSLSSDKLSNLSELPSQTVENLPVTSECAAATNNCGNVITPRAQSDDPAFSAQSGNSEESSSNTVYEDSIDFIDNVNETSTLFSEAVEMRKSDSPSGISDMKREASDCQSVSDVSISAMSVSSGYYREDSVLETMRSNAGSALSYGSNYVWPQEESMGSAVSMDSDGSSSRDKDEFATARESLNSTASSESDRMSGTHPFKPGELTDRLIEGPRITLPPSQLPVIPSYPNPLDIETTGSASSTSESSGHQQESNTTGGGDLAQAHVTQMDTQPSYAEVVKSDSQGPHTAQDEHGKLQESISSEGGTNTTSTSAVNTSTVPAESITQPSTNTSSKADSSTESAAKPKAKRTPNDFIFGKVIGEGAYSTVYLAKEVSTQREFAIKVCDKKHLIRERKTHFVMREKEVLMKLDHPYFIKLAYTFQDPERLYYVLTYARNGELLGYLHKLSAFDVPCTRFYSAEIVLALEYLHGLGIIHRDLKPENILLSEDMHIKITDFGTSKILSLDSNGNAENMVEVKRKNSFVGTAEYVSPEVLNNLPANYGSDLWALGCIIYQCLSGSMPFRSGNEYQTFQKIVKVEYDFPEGFHPDAKDLVEKLLVLESSQRIGMIPPEGMNAIKRHPYYKGIDWDNLPQTTPPKLMPYLPATANNPEFWGQEQRTGFDDQRLAEIITGQSADGSMSPELEEIPVRGFNQAEEDEQAEKLRKQRLENQFHQFVEDNLIIRQGFVDKRKGLFARKRMLLLTEGPHLYYVDAHNKVLKGEIPWSKYLRPEAKNFKIFFVHTPNRTYYLESRQPDAQQWVKQIQEVWKRYYEKEKK